MLVLPAVFIHMFGWKSKQLELSASDMCVFNLLAMGKTSVWMNITQKPNFSSHTKENFVKILLNLLKHDTKIAVGIGEGRARSKEKTSEGFLCNLKMALVPRKSRFPVKAYSSISTNCGLLLLFRFFFLSFYFLRSWLLYIILMWYKENCHSTLWEGDRIN